MAQTISLDNINSALFWALEKWTPSLKRNQSVFLLRTLACRLYGVNSNLFSSRVQVSQDALAESMGLSREWVCKLLVRLERVGWIEYYAPRLPDGHFLPCVFKVGGQLKRLLCVLLRYRRPYKNRVNDSSQSLPQRRDIKKSFNFIQKLREEVAAKLGRNR